MFRPRTTSPRSLIFLLASLAITVSDCLADDPPNVIVIYTDDQGYGDASCLNPDAKVTTPNLDRLAREGITFTDAHSSDTVCTPSRYGLLTGRYSWRTELKRGVFGAERECLIEDDRVTLASFLRDHGYSTAMVGKWHLGMQFPGTRENRDWSQPVRDMPLDKGFEDFWGIPASMNYGVLAWFDGRYAAVPPTRYTAKKPNEIAINDYRIMPPYEEVTSDPGTTDRWGVVRGSLEVAPDFVDAECLTRFTDRAIDRIERHLDANPDADLDADPDAELDTDPDDDRNRDAPAPFFLYLAYTSPHKPVIPIERFRGQSQAGAYGDFLIETDWHIGRILDVLDRRGIAEETLVIVTSDNGPENTWVERDQRFGHRSNGPYREGKRSIYEGGHRVPFFVRWPGRCQPGRVVDAAVCQTDLLATFAELLGETLPDDAGEDSVSFLGLLDGDDGHPARPPMIHHSARGGFAVRHGNWKLIMEGKGQRRELYDLASDPGETEDLLGTNPEIEKKLEGEITRIVLSGRTSEGPPQPNDVPWWDDLMWIEP